MKKLTFISGAVLASVLLLMTACAAPRAPGTIIIGYDKGAVGPVPIYVAEDKGWFKEEGVDIMFEPSSFFIAVEQLVAGDLDTYGLYWLEKDFAAVGKGLDLVVIAGLSGGKAPDYNTMSLVVQREFHSKRKEKPSHNAWVLECCSFIVI